MTGAASQSFRQRSEGGHFFGPGAKDDTVESLRYFHYEFLPLGPIGPRVYDEAH